MGTVPSTIEPVSYTHLDVAKQSLMAAGSGLLKAKGLDTNAVPGSVIAAPELSKNLDNDKIALKEYNSLLAYGATPAEAYAESLMGVSKACLLYTSNSLYAQAVELLSKLPGLS